MRSLGMEPMAPLHHFVPLQWFEELGASEREEDIAHFLDWHIAACHEPTG